MDFHDYAIAAPVSTLSPEQGEETMQHGDVLLFAPPVGPSNRDGPRAVTRLMVDKVITVQKSKIGARVGWVADE